MSETKSIYQYIEENKRNGCLPDLFSLPSADSDSRFRFADGAMDGISIFHMRAAEIDPEMLEKLGSALEAAGQREFSKARALLEEVTEKHRAINMIDQLEDYIIDHREELNLHAVHDFGMELMTGSGNTELVKAGMEILEVYAEPGEEQKERIRTLGLSDEFTLFSVFHMLRWTKGNEEIFELAKKVHGWGRIHALERLKPETQEIKDWLLYEGLLDHILPEYSALTCYQKSDVAGRLEGSPSPEEYRAIGDLLCALLSEGPVAGISAVDQADHILLSFVQKSNPYLEGADDYDRIRQLLDYAAPKEELTELKSACRQILSSQKCQAAALAAVQNGENVALATALGIDCCEPLLQCLRADFDKHYIHCGLLLKNTDYVKPALTVFRENLPLSQMASGPADDMGLDKQGKPYRQLGFLIQNFRSLPTCTGEDFIQTAINAPVINNRSMALRVMKSWVAKEQKPLRLISESLWLALEKACEREVRKDLKPSMRALLDGNIEFKEDEL